MVGEGAIGAVAVVSLVIFALLFFGIALYSNSARAPAWLWRHPLVHGLSLFGASGLVFYFGTVEIAGRYGLAGLLGLLAYTVVFIFSPLFIDPLRWISRAFSFTSLPDLLVYRFRTAGVARAATLTLAIACLPIAGAQLKLAAGALFVDNGPQLTLMTLFAATGVGFIFFFGSRGKTRRALPPLLATAAVLSLAALVATGLLAVYGVFGGFGQLEAWARDSGQAAIIQRLDYAYALILVFFTAGLVLPQFVYLQTLGKWSEANISLSSWLLPLLILVATLPMFPVLWAGLDSELDAPLQYYLSALPLALGQPLLHAVVLIAGFFMAVGLLVVLAMAVARTLVTSFLVPRHRYFNDRDLESWLHRCHFRFAALWILAALTLAMVTPVVSITGLTLTGLVGLTQLAPGLIGTLYAPRINRQGFLAGLATGLAIWTIGLLYPLLTGNTSLDLPWGASLALGLANWPYWLLESLIANLAITVLVSLLTRTTEDERVRAHNTMVDSLPIPQRSGLAVASLDEVRDKLTARLGAGAADKAITRAGEALQLGDKEHRPLALRMFRDQLSFGLSADLGVYASEKLINEVMPLDHDDRGQVDDISLLETHLASAGGALSGLAAELNKLRLYHRQTLENLPIGVCSVDREGEILLWNHTMSHYVGAGAGDMEGANLDDLPPRWSTLLKSFADGDDTRLPTIEMPKPGDSGDTAWYHLQKTQMEQTSPFYAGNQIILVEDVSERLRLIQELAHTERLSSVGRLAAGVAHEIGNPVTGISCLAQDLKAQETSEEIFNTADMILTQTDRISRIVSTLIDFSRSDDNSHHGAIELARPIADAIQLLLLDKSAKPVVFDNQVTGDILVKGDGHQLTQVFVNLLSNARDASDENGLISIDYSIEDTGTRAIRIRDWGSGIPGPVLDKVMDPFFTTKDPGAGTGLGLSLAYSIIRLHQGTIEIDSPASQRGTTVTVRLNAP